MPLHLCIFHPAITDCHIRVSQRRDHLGKFTDRGRTISIHKHNQLAPRRQYPRLYRRAFTPIRRMLNHPKSGEAPLVPFDNRHGLISTTIINHNDFSDLSPVARHVADHTFQKTSQPNLFVICRYNDGDTHETNANVQLFSLPDRGTLCHANKMILSGILTLAAALVGARVLVPQQRWLTLGATAVILAQAQWLFLTLGARTIGAGLPVDAVVSGGALVLLLLWAAAWRTRPPLPSLTRRTLVKDCLILLVLVPVIASAALIASRNGFQGDTWITHGFYNGDTVTFAALVERSLHTTTLVDENPFAANGPLEYPTLLHAGVANVLQLINQTDDWFRLWPLFTYLQIISTIPLLFLLTDVLVPEPTSVTKRWLGIPSRRLINLLQTGLVVAVMTLSWDNYTFPQSHFFLTGIFLLQIIVLQVSQRLSGKAQLLPIVVGTVLAGVLVGANAVTGTAAIVCLIAAYALRALEKQRPVPERAAWAIGVLVILGLFLQFTPGNGAIGIMPGFSYTATLDLTLLALPLVIIGGALLWHLARYPFIAASVAGMMLLAAITFFFSERDLIIANASRFYYHALLASFPLAIYPLIRAGIWTRRELLHTTHSLGTRLSAWTLTGTVVLLLTLPSLASIASTHDNLLFKDEQVVSESHRQALTWIKEHTAPDAVILAQPDTPWAVPLFTGRALVRTNFWHSPEDLLAADVTAAFNGNRAAQEKVIDQAQYLLLEGDEHAAWEPLHFRPVFTAGNISLYDLNAVLATR